MSKFEEYTILTLIEWLKNKILLIRNTRARTYTEKKLKITFPFLSTYFADLETSLLSAGILQTPISIPIWPFKYSPMYLVKHIFLR